MTAQKLFETQIDLIVAAFDENAILIGDLNLGFSRKHNIGYSNAPLFDLFDLKLGSLDLVQLVDFPTWLRFVGQSLRSSCLDQFYVKDNAIINYVNHIKPCFGNLELVMIGLCITRPNPNISLRRDWRFYSKDKLESALSAVDWTTDATAVQEIWNVFENKLISIVDKLARMSEFVGNNVKTKISPTIKRKLNTRKRLSKILKLRPTLDTKNQISNLNIEIRNHFYSEK